MAIVRTVGLSVLVSLAVMGHAPARQNSATAPRVVQIEVGDNMKFSVTTISTRPGERLKVVLKDVGRMPKVAMAHNFVLLKKGASGKDFVDKSVNARATDFIAPEVKGQVLANTGLVGPGETTDVTFAAPNAAGDYLYLCSFPGHFALGMKGTLTVK